MAEQFIIRIQPDRANTSSRAGDSSSIALVGSSLLQNSAKGMILSPEKPLNSLKNAKDFLLSEAAAGLQGFVESGFSERYGFAAEDGRVTNPIHFQKSKTSQFGTNKIEMATTYHASGRGRELTYDDRHEAYYRNVLGRGADYVVENQKAMLLGGLALSQKVLRSYVSHKQHRSGDTYYNQQLNNSLKLAGYGTAIGLGFMKGGPAGAALVAGGIAINEAISFRTESANFDYDRMMDKQYVHNIKQVAGDISYGRRRRGDR